MNLYYVTSSSNEELWFCENKEELHLLIGAINRKLAESKAIEIWHDKGKTCYNIKTVEIDVTANGMKIKLDEED